MYVHYGLKKIYNFKQVYIYHLSKNGLFYIEKSPTLNMF